MLLGLLAYCAYCTVLVPTGGLARLGRPVFLFNQKSGPLLRKFCNAPCSSRP